MTPDPQDLRPLLRPVSRPGQAWRVALHRPERAIVRRRVLPFLHVLLVLDHPHHMVYVGRHHLAALGMSFSQALSEGLDRLDPVAGLRREDDGLWRLAAGDGYEPARLLLPGWLRAFSERVPGRPLAAVPNHHRLFVGGEDQAAALLARATRDWSDTGMPVSPLLYTAGAEGALLPWQPPPEHPLAPRLQAALRELALREYENQRQELEALFEGAVFAPVRAHGAGVEVRLATRWTQGTVALLPPVDLVELRPEEGEPLWVATDRLVRILSLPPWPDLDPPRLRAATWPSRSQWSRLAQGALSDPPPGGPGDPGGS